MLSKFTGYMGGDLKGNLPSPRVISLTDATGFRTPILSLVEGLYLKVVNGQIVASEVPGGGGGTNDHSQLINRNILAQHISYAIDITDAGPFNKNLIGKTNLRQAMNVLDELDFSGQEDHLVKAGNSDVTTVGGLHEKNLAGTGILQTLATDGGVQKLKTSVTGLVVAVDPATEGNISPDRPAGLTERIAVTYPLTKIVAGNNPERYVLIGLDQTTPQPTPGAGAKYYTAQIDNATIKTAKAIMTPLDRWEDVDCVGLEYPDSPQLLGWYQGDDGSWWRTATGALTADDFNGVTPYLNMRFFLGTPVGTNPFWGIYKIADLGSDTTQASIVRTLDANSAAQFTYAKPVYIKYGTNWANHTFKFATAGTIVLDTTQLLFADAGTSSIYAHSGVLGFGSVWVPVDGQPYTWDKRGETLNAIGFELPTPTTGIGAAPGSPVQFQVGDKFLIIDQTDLYNESQYSGYYEFVVYSQYFNTQRIRRCLDANTPETLTNLTVLIDNPSAFYNGVYETQTQTIETLDTTPTVWTSSTNRPIGGDTVGLYTASQLISENTSLNTYTKVLGASPDLVYWEDVFESLPIGVDKIPAGRHYFQVQDVFLSSTSGTPGTTILWLKLSYTDGAGHVLGDILTKAYGTVTWTTPQTVSWYYDLNSDFNIAPTNTVRLQLGIQTTYSNFSELTYTYNSPARGTWWQSTINSTSITTTNRSIWVPASNLTMDGANLKGHTLLGSLGQRTDSIGLPDGTTNGVSCVVQIPTDSTSQPITIRPVWSPGANASGAIRWALKIQNVIGSDITSGPSAINFTGLSQSFVFNNSVIENGTLSSPLAPSAGSLVRIGLYRLGGDTLDTYTSVANLLGIQIDYTANK